MNKRITELPAASTLFGEELAEIVQGGVNKKVPISSFGIGAMNLIGPYDLSVNQYPETGGTGPLGQVMKGNIWWVAVQGEIEIGNGVALIEERSLLIALTDEPGQDYNFWKVLQ